jgi:hypothetical protein
MVTMIANSTAAVNAGRFPPAFLAVSMSLTSNLLISGYLFREQRRISMNVPTAQPDLIRRRKIVSRRGPPYGLIFLRRSFQKSLGEQNS